MLISGIQSFTMLDYPGKTACIIFTAGCNFRCGYCHNPEFVMPEALAKLRDSFIPENIVFNFLDQRRGLLEGVVVTGGEPTIHHDLIPFLRKLKSKGFLVKLDTNGNKPEVIKQALVEGVVDYIAMDVKTSLAQYPCLVGNLVSTKNIAESIECIKTSGVPYEFRSTIIKETHPPTVLQEMVELVSGADKLCLQTFRPGTTLEPSFGEYHSFSENEMVAVADLFKDKVKEVVLR